MRAKLLVTGHEGYIGSHFTIRVLQNDMPHWATDIKNGGYDYRTWEGYEFETVVHFAADASVTKSLKDPDGCFENNAFGLIPFLTKNKIGKFIFMSTGGAIYGNKLNAKEEDASWAGCISPYGQSKYLAEKIVRKLQRNHCIFRLGNVYGGNDADRLELAAHARFKKDNPIVVYGGSQIRDFVHVDVVCEAIIRAMRNDTTGTFNIGSGEATKVIDIANSIGLERGVDIRLLPARAGEIERVSLDITKAKAAGLL